MIRYIAANGYFLMFAGTDTTSNALLRMAVLLNRYPDWFRKIQAEQDRLREEYGDTIDRRVCKPPPPSSPFPRSLLHVVLALHMQGAAPLQRPRARCHCSIPQRVCTVMLCMSVPPWQRHRHAPTSHGHTSLAAGLPAMKRGRRSLLTTSSTNKWRREFWGALRRRGGMPGTSV